MPKELEILEEIARIATREALKDYIIPEEWVKNLVKGTLFKGNERVFELYVPGAKPEDAIVISSARVNRDTKEVQITVSNLKRRGVL